MNNKKEEYFNWMLNKIFYDESLMRKYLPLLMRLNSIPFEWTIEMDENRQKDAQDLRYIFGYENGYSETEICHELDIEEPTLLEVIVALVNRAKENILYDLELDTINQDIFMDILKSLNIIDLQGELDNNANLYLLNVICNLYNRKYSYFGNGGLFTVNNPKFDMRETEIWFQFMWYLDEKLGGKYL